MTIDRKELRRLCEADPDDERQCAKCRVTMSFPPETDPSALCNLCTQELTAAIPTLLDELDAKDKAIDWLIKDSILEAANEAWKDRRIAELERMRDYQGFEGWPCTLCAYDGGRFIRHCAMHARIEVLEAEIERVTKAAKAKIEQLQEQNDLRSVISDDERKQLEHHIRDHQVTCSYSCSIIKRLLSNQVSG